MPEGDRNQPRLDFDLEDLLTERTSGVLYKSKIDSIIFDVKSIKASTEHQILSVVATLYYPLGVLSRVILGDKRLLQEL